MTGALLLLGTTISAECSAERLKDVESLTMVHLDSFGFSSGLVLTYFAVEGFMIFSH